MLYAPWTVVRDKFVCAVLEDILLSITQLGGQWNGLGSLCLLLNQRALPHCTDWL
jgi:hypothetical protein